MAISVAVEMCLHAGTWAHVVEDDSPVGWWPMSQLGSNNTQVLDRTANANHGDHAAAQAFLSQISDAIASNFDDQSMIDPVNTDANSIFMYGHSVNLDGTNDGIDVTDPPGGELDFGSGAFSVEVVARFDRDSGTHYLVHKRTTAGAAGYALRYDSDNNVVRWRVGDGTTNVNADYSVDLDDGKYHHFVATRGASNLYLYIDGVLRASPSTSGMGSTSNVNDFLIGYDTASGYFKGNIDEVVVYAKDLGQARVTVHYAAMQWHDVTADVTYPGIRGRYGIQGAGPLDRVASPGFMTFWLDNTSGNSAATAGYYSPDHASVRTNFDVGALVRMKWSGGSGPWSHYKFFGHVTDIRPNVGPEQFTTLVTAHDWFGLIVDEHMDRTAIQVNTTAQAAWETVLNASNRPPKRRTMVKPTVDVLPFVLDSSPEESVSVYGELQKLAATELGYMFQIGDSTSGGALRFQSRGHRNILGSSGSAFNDDMQGLQVIRSKQTKLNHVHVLTHPKRQDTTNVVLYQLRDASEVTTASALRIGPGESIDLIMPYTNPNERTQRVGASSVETPVATTDYLMNKLADGSDRDLTADLTVSGFDAGATAAFATLTNSGNVTGFVTKFDLRGKGIYDEAVAEWEHSVEGDRSFGPHIFVDLPYQAGGQFGKNAASWLIDVFAGKSRASRLRLYADFKDDFIEHAIRRDPGDRITLTETKSGLTQQNYFIQSVDFEVDRDQLVWVEYGLTPADPIAWWWLGNHDLGTESYLGL